MNLNLYRKKAALDRALNGKAVSGQKFEVFAIHSRGYFTREPLCTDHLHETILDACVCANIKSVGKDMEKYGAAIEIVQLSGTVGVEELNGREHRLFQEQEPGGNH